MDNIIKYLRYDWPLHFVLLLTNWLPDNVLFLRLRGWLAHWFFGGCGENLRLGRNINFYNPSTVFLGSDVYISYGCFILSIGEITIGDEVLFGPYVVLSAGDHTRKDGSYRYGIKTESIITIGDGSWIGSHASILGSSTIGKGSIVGAQSCVIKGNYQDNILLAGVPAIPKKNL